MLGPTGTGKTTLGRIIAQSYTCKHPGPDGKPCFTCPSCKFFTESGPGHHPDVWELNCGSETGIDVIRSIGPTASSFPTFGRHRVIFLDEIQKLSEAAKQAAFKLIEEPKAKTLFILGSMEPEKFTTQTGKALKNRSLSVFMQKPATKDVVDRLRVITEAYGASISDSVLTTIAYHSDCSMREAVTILDVAISSGDTTGLTSSSDEAADAFVSSLSGGSPYRVASSMFEAILSKNIRKALESATAVADKRYLLKILVEQSTNTIKCRFNPLLVDNAYARRVAIDIAKTSGLKTSDIAVIGKKIMEAQRLVAEYSVDPDAAITHVISSIWPS